MGQGKRALIQVQVVLSWAGGTAQLPKGCHKTSCHIGEVDVTVGCGLWTVTCLMGVVESGGVGSVSVHSMLEVHAGLLSDLLSPPSRSLSKRGICFSAPWSGTHSDSIVARTPRITATRVFLFFLHVRLRDLDPRLWRLARREITLNVVRGLWT